MDQRDLRRILPPQLTINHRIFGITVDPTSVASLRLERVEWRKLRVDTDAKIALWSSLRLGFFA